MTQQTNSTTNNSCILSFQELDKSMIALAGGKGANLGELSRIEGILVPDGFCITTEAYKSMVGGSQRFNELLHQLSPLKVQDRDKISAFSREKR
jgi:pyruvate,water dikinase